LGITGSQPHIFSILTFYDDDVDVNVDNDGDGDDDDDDADKKGAYSSS